MSIEGLIAALIDPGQALVVSKLAQLSTLGENEIALLAESWAEMALQKRQRLVVELIDLAEDSVDLNFDAVYFVGLEDGDTEVRRDSIRGLWEHESRRLTDALLGLLTDDSDAGVRAEAALALGRVVLQSALEGARPAIVDVVDARLREAYGAESEMPEVRGRALESLGARDEPWVHKLIDEACESGERRLRISALHAMGRSCDDAWLPALYTELEGEDGEARFEAAGAIGAIAADESVTYLLPLLDDEDAEVQEAAIAALGEIGGGPAKEALTELVSGAGDRVREAAEAALESLAIMDDPLTVETPS